MPEKPIHKQTKETDIAFHLLQGNRTMNIKELVEQILSIKGITDQDMARAMARIYTSLIQDTRFSFKGGGLWGLRDWKGEKPRKTEPDLLPSEKQYQPKAKDYIWDDEADDEDEEEEEEEQEIIDPPNTIF